MNAFTDPVMAACDKHLPNHLREAIPDNMGMAARITNVAKPDERYTCSCGVPAHWYVRVFLPDEDKEAVGS